NNGKQAHEMAIYKLNNGATLQDLQAALADPSAGPPPATPAGGVAALAPGGSAELTLPDQPGDYVAICFIPRRHRRRQTPLHPRHDHHPHPRLTNHTPTQQQGRPHRRPCSPGGLGDWTRGPARSGPARPRPPIVASWRSRSTTHSRFGAGG